MEFQFRADREAHLRMLCAEMGRTVDDFISEAVLASMEDFEDGRDASQVLARVQNGDEATISLEELMQRYGMEDRDLEDGRKAAGSLGQDGQESHSEVSSGKNSHAA